MSQEQSFTARIGDLTDAQRRSRTVHRHFMLDFLKSDLYTCPAFPGLYVSPLGWTVNAEWWRTEYPRVTIVDPRGDLYMVVEDCTVEYLSSVLP